MRSYNNCCQITMEESVCHIQTMKCQEESIYIIHDYFKSIPAASINNIDVECRIKMGIWCYEVVDFCKYNYETAQIALSYLDRYLSTEDGMNARYDRSQYQLACMTSIYIAGKIHESEVIDPQTVSILSRNLYSVDTIVQMEQKMLNAIQWRVNPPTSMSFYREFMNILPIEIHDNLFFHNVPVLAHRQIERAILEYDFMTIKASMLAFCSLVNAIEHLVGDEYIVSIVRLILTEALGIDCNSDEFIQTKRLLNEIVIPEYIKQMETNVLYSKESRPPVLRTNSPRRISSV
jgi:Cyclin, N-terminal domain